MSKNYITQGTQSPSEILVVDNTSGGRFLTAPVPGPERQGIFYDGCLVCAGDPGGWVNVQINGQTSYVSAIMSARSTAWPAPCTVKPPTLSQPAPGPAPGTPCCARSRGPVAMVLLQGNGWWKVSIDRYVGFMSGDFLVEA